MAAQASNTPERMHGLDALRGIALLLGVMLHTSLSFLPGANTFWITSDVHANAALGLFFYIPHNFRMILFFLLAGFFAHMSLHRLGWKGFIKDRWKRIAVPLLVGWPIVMCAIVAVLVWSAVIANGGTLPKQSPPGPTFTPGDFPLTHLWFLYELLLCYVAALLLRSANASLDRKGRLRAWVDGCMRRFVGWPIAPMLLAVPLSLGLVAQTKWLPWFGIPTPDQALYPNLPAAIGFGTAFAFGWLLHRQGDLLRVFERRWKFNLAFALIATIVSLSMVGLTPNVAPAAHDWHTFAYAAVYSLAAWSWTFALLGMALRFGSGYSPARRYLADASYWIYLAHLPLVMALQVALARLDWPALLKFPLLLAIVFTIPLASYHWLVRYSFIGAVLNGRRNRRSLNKTIFSPV
jgi:peptidoglycan/LPS O-acetylase OafA/YrhL